jgi:hypothetical protein
LRDTASKFLIEGVTSRTVTAIINAHGASKCQILVLSANGLATGTALLVFHARRTFNRAELRRAPIQTNLVTGAFTSVGFERRTSGRGWIAALARIVLAGCNVGKWVNYSIAHLE